MLKRILDKLRHSPSSATLVAMDMLKVTISIQNYYHIIQINNKLRLAVPLYNRRSICPAFSI